MTDLRILLYDSPGEAAALRLLADGALREAAGRSRALRIDTVETPEEFRQALREKPFYYNILIVGYHFGQFEKHGVLPELEKVRRQYLRQVLLFATSSCFLPAELASLQCAGVLKKPFQRDNVREVLQRAAEECRLMEAGRGISADDGGRTVMLREWEILYGRRSRNGVQLVTERGEYRTRMELSLFEEEEELPFFRCHNSYFVNLRHVRSFDGKKFLLETGESVPVSRRYQAAARRLCSPSGS